jgi:hypothetical protein
MGIDGIGKPGPGGLPGSLPGAASSGPVGKAGEEFKVTKSSAAPGVEGSDALGRLERGEIALDDYLDARSAEAVRHLEGKLPAEQLQFVQQTLREQLATDPVLVELVRRATGKLPSEPAG